MCGLVLRLVRILGNPTLPWLALSQPIYHGLSYRISRVIRNHRLHDRNQAHRLKKASVNNLRWNLSWLNRPTDLHDSVHESRWDLIRPIWYNNAHNSVADKLRRPHRVQLGLSDKCRVFRTYIFSNYLWHLQYLCKSDCHSFSICS